MKNKFINPFNSAPLAGDDRRWSTPWNLFFQHLYKKRGLFDAFEMVSGVEVSGTDDVVDSFKASFGNFVWYIIFIKNDTNIRGGMLMVTWADDGTLATRHGQNEIMDIGDTSDQMFSFNYDATTEKIQLLSTSTETYSISYFRVVIT